MAAAFRVGMLGMGRIAAGFDAPEGPAVRTHVKAILAEPRLRITHIADRDPERAANEAKRFGLGAAIVSPEVIASADLDALCIASPDGTHIAFVERAAEGSVRVVLSEKPLEGDAIRRRTASSALAARNAALAIHHLRRWIPGVSEAIAEARAGGFGRPLSAVVHYTRGFRHNGIHALDLIAAFLGARVDSVAAIGEPVIDYDQSDPTLSLLIGLASDAGKVPLAMFGVDGRVQTVFSVDLRFERARVSIFDDAGIRAEIHRPRDVGFPGYAPELGPAVRFHDDPPHLVAEVWRNVADHLATGAPLICSGEDALQAYDLADTILARLPA